MNHKKVKLGPVLASTFASLFYPQVVLLIFLPFFISLAVVIIGLWLTWGFWTSYFYSGSLAFQPYWIWLMEHSPVFINPIFNFLSAAAPWLLFLFLFALSYPLVMALNLLIISLLTSTYLVQFLARRDYKDLEIKGRPRRSQAIWNTISGVALFLFLWAITLPFWLIPGMALVLPLILTAWLNRRICYFDALTDYASDEELNFLTEVNSKSAFILGLMTAFLNSIPFAFFISPVLTMVGFIHFSLSSLQSIRKGSN